MSQEQEQTPSANSEAHSLRTAREQLKLTQQEVAQRLRLPLRVITSIDNQRYENLAEPAYVRGYLRAYANLVGIDPAAVIRHYDINFAPDNPEVQPFKSHPAQQFRSNELWVKAVSWLVITVLLLLLGAWLKNRYFDTPAEAPAQLEDSSQTGAAISAPPLPTEQPDNPDSAVPMTENDEGVSEFFPPEEEDVFIPQVPALPESTTVDSPAEILSTASSTVPDEFQQPEPSGLLPDETITAEQETTTDTVSEPASADPGADTPVLADPAQTLAPAPAAQTPTSDDRGDSVKLRLKTAEKAWIEITDAEGQKVYYNLAQAGSDTEMTGIAPLTLLVGNSEKVSLEVNGEAFDLSAFSLEGIARLILNADGSASEDR